MVEPSALVTPEDVARHYDQLDRFYRDIWGDHVHHGYWETGRESSEEAAHAMVDQVIAFAHLKPEMEVLDVGCGYGAAARIMARRAGVRVTGITLSALQQQRAAEITTPESNPRFLTEDWLQNQRPTESFDRVIAMESTEHMADKGRAFAEMARVLRPGGRMVVSAWLAANHRTSWQDAHLIEPVCREARLASLGTPEEYAAWIAAAGLDLGEQADISEHVSKTWPTCAWRFLKGVLRRPGHLRILMDRKDDNRVFGLTMFRIWLGYRLGAIRMVLFAATKPPHARI